LNAAGRCPAPWAIAAVWVLWLLNALACSSGPLVRSYVLTAAAAPTAQSSGTSVPAPGRLQVRRVLVPDYLDTTDITLRSGPHEVKASTTGRWGERLSEGLTDALAADLAARLPPDSVIGQVLVTVEALDLWPDGRCVLAARWRIVDADNAAQVVSGSETFATPGAAARVASDDASRVAAVAQTVGRLADSIAASARLAPGRADLGSQALPAASD
jgi:uncharacterized lipoprotein YmbA